MLQKSASVVLIFLGAISNVYAAAPHFQLMTAASSVASRSDRRPNSGGLYDATVDKTFIAWSGQNADTYVQAYTHGKKSWTVPKRIADGEADSHNYPMLVSAPDGHLLVIRGLHNTRTVVHRAPTAHSIDGNWTEIQVTAGDADSYPFPVTTRQGKLIVFYRETTEMINTTANTDFRPMKYLVSDDNGVNWNNSVELTGKQWAFGSQGRADHMDEVYVGQVRYVPDLDTIDIVYTLAGGGPTQHKHDVLHRNVYYLAFNTQSRHFFSAAGKDLGLQVDDAAQEAFLKITETPLELPGGNKSPDYILHVGRQNNGSPFVLWMQFDDWGVVQNFAAAYNPKGNSWDIKKVTHGVRVKDMEPLGRGKWRVYGARDNQTDVETFILQDGKTWTPETRIQTDTPVQRIELITGFKDPARILATGAATERNVSIARGDIYVAGL